MLFARAAPSPADRPPHRSPGESNSAWSAFGAMLLGMALMAPVLDDKPLGLDECVSAWIVDGDSPGSLWTRTLRQSATPPFSHMLQQISVAILGETPLALRLPSAISYVAAIGLTFLAGRAVGGSGVGELAAFWLALHPDVVDRVRVGRPYGTALAASAGLAWALARWTGNPASRRWPFAALAFSVALGWTHYLAWPGLALAMAAFPWCVGSKSLGIRGWTNWGIVVLALVIGLAPLRPAVDRLRDVSAVLAWRTMPPSLGSQISPWLWLGLPVAVVASMLILRMRPVDRSKLGNNSPSHAMPARSVVPRGALSVILCVAAAPFVLTIAASYMSNPSLGESRYRVACWPGLACLVAWLLHSIDGRGWTCRLSTVAGLLAVWSMADYRPWHSPEFSTPESIVWRNIHAALDRESGSNDFLFVHGGLAESRLVPAFGGDSEFHDYVACRATRFGHRADGIRVALPWAPPLPRGNDVRSLTRFPERYGRDPLRGCDRAWLAVATDTDLAQMTVERWASCFENTGWTRTDVVAEPRAVLVRFDRSQP